MGKVYTIYLTTECNFQCTYCYEEYTKCLILDKEMLKDILDFIIDLESNKDSDAFAVNFMGGEPLLKKELIYQAVNYIKEKCKKKVLYYITTNGSLLNEEMISWMKENDFFVRISIDGNKETHKKNRLQKDGNSAYATIMQNLKFIKKSGLKYTIRMTVANNTLDQIYDLFALRILVNSVKDCYAALGVVHEMYSPMPGRFKDYIANQKANGYQSIHTTVYGPKGPIEFQIRTVEMHQVAEYGVAAHWAYKRGGKATASEKELRWINNLIELQEGAGGDAQTFVDSVKEDIFTERIYVFTPDGAVRELPKDSVPIDFAYEIHTKVGERATGAKVNGRMVPLTTKLKTGDQVEIITSANQKPTSQWLDYVTTSRAKNKIKD